MSTLRHPVSVLALLAPLLLSPTCPLPEPVERGRFELPGLSTRVRVSTDALGVPHVEAVTLADAFRVQGWLQARDRFFQMDVLRHTAEGRLAELTGDPTALGSDPVTRTLGLRAAAERSAALLEPAEVSLLQGYVEGINAFLATQPLPPEYAILERSSVRPWELVDSLLLAKAFSANLNAATYQVFDDDILASYRAALGEAAGTALFFEDVARVAPMVAVATVPDALGIPFARNPAPAQAGLVALDRRPWDSAFRRSTSAFAQRLRAFGADRAAGLGSNVWGVTGEHSASGTPMVANDSHLALGNPSQFYETHLSITADPLYGAIELSGYGLPWAPGIILGQSRDVAWGSTQFASADISDVFRDRLVRDHAQCPARLCIVSEGAFHPVVETSERYFFNSVGDGIPDNAVEFTAILPPQATHVLRVPFRSFGPIVEVEDRSVVDAPAPGALETHVLTLQFTALHGAREGRALVGLATAHDVADVREAVRGFATLPSHFVAADSQGTLAYFTSGEIPLRADLEAGTPVDGVPIVVQDGSGANNWLADPARSQGQQLPFRVLPPEEMPQVLNPPSGFVVNANNDPTGAGFDNDLANRLRPGSPTAIQYFGPEWSAGLRAGRITEFLRERIAAGGELTLDDMRELQADTHARDALLAVPPLVRAWDRAREPGASAVLAAFAADGQIAEAVARLAAWDTTTPTGIPEGYDAADENGLRSATVAPGEAAASVAATLFAVWRQHLVERVIQQPLAALGLREDFTVGSWIGVVWLLAQDPFTGVGASGVDFFPDPSGLPAEDRRDVALLASMRTALDLLASPPFDPAFAGSTDLDDYRWGRLHRLVLRHPLSFRNSAYSIPPAAGFADLSPGLPGLARDGAWNTVNVAAFGDSSTPAEFTFLASATYRLASSPAHPAAGPDGALGFGSLPGGASGDPASPQYASQLGAWLTGDAHRLLMNSRDVRAAARRVELFEPPP